MGATFGAVIAKVVEGRWAFARVTTNSSARLGPPSVGWISFRSPTSMSRPLKPYASISELIELLQRRGMTVDADLAQQWLMAVGYYRLSGYWYVYRELDPRHGQQRTDRFMPGTTFADVAGLYEFDRKLRGHVLDGLERVEVALRSGLNEAVGSLGPLAYGDSKHFRPEFKHEAWLSTVDHRLKRAGRSSSAVRHYEQKYGGHFPLWVLADVLDFADASQMFQGLLIRQQWAVAERLGITIEISELSMNQRNKVKKHHPLTRWLEQLTIIRNTCAHHSRLWNRSFVPVGTAALRTMPELTSLPIDQSEHLYGAMLVTAKILETASPGSSWASRLLTLAGESLEAIPRRQATELGCPPGWRSGSIFDARERASRPLERITLEPSPKRWPLT